ncbi:MAG: TlpA family protein disulfide reductase [Elusimicrobia bacterium]|nr:TlpA family protein disulfide reductase [Candidatus Liberimonas magnetica]
MSNKLLRAAAIILSLLITVGLVFADIKVGDNAPDFSLKDLKGNTYSLEKHKGKNIIFLNFFATWCENCIEEMAQLKELYQNYKSKGLDVVSINVQENPAKVKKFIEKNQLPFPVLLDSSASVAKDYGLVGFPSNIIVDGEGKIRFMDSRPPANFEEVFAAMKDTIKPAKKIDKKAGKK